MDNSRETAVHLYEVLTGVFNDEQSKIIRLSCFAVLFLGMVWAGFNYFRATILSDTTTPIDEELFQDTRPPSNEASIQRIVELARTVDTMRAGGEAIVYAVQAMHRMPFNLDPVEYSSVPSGTDASTAMLPPDVPPPGAAEPQAGPLTVRMIMTAESGQKIAVVDAGGKSAVVVRKGDELPGNAGFVASITSNAITVIFNNKEVRYEISEIKKFDEIK
ncbi:MAG: hypothetical protein IJG65_03460 [Synergistaceae bacterium]|nr:hypothetical protein [Synergistaceae bacterium]